MSDLIERLKKAKGSKILKTVLLGMFDAERTCIEAATELTRLRARVAELEEVIDSAEIEHGLTSDGSLWRFWSKRACDVAVKLAGANARVSELEAAQTWQPIETIPDALKTGAEVELAWEPDDLTTGRGYCRGGVWFAGAIFYDSKKDHPPFMYREHIVDPFLWRAVAPQPKKGE